MRTGGPTPADSAHNGTESAPFPVRLTENGLTADAGKKERLQRDSQAWGDSPSRRQAAMRYGHRNDAGIPVQLKVSGGTAETSLLWKGRPWNLFRPVPGSARKRNRSAYLISYISLWEGDSFAESSKNTEKEVL